jgi:polysaccharide biosynthesis transport protein
LSTLERMPVRASSRPPALPELLAPPSEYSPPGMSLTQILTIVRAYWRHTTVITVSLMALIAGILEILPKTYTATATLMVNYELNQNGKEFPIGEVGSYMATQIEFMKSDRVLLPVIEALHLEGESEFTAGFSGRDSSERRLWVLKNLRSNLDITQGHGSQLLYVEAGARDPLEAAKIANAVADVYLVEERRLVNEPASQRARDYTARLEELQEKVNAAQEKVTRFRQGSGLSDIAGRDGTEAQTLSSLEQQLVAVQNARRTAESKRLGDQQASVDVLSSETIQTLKGDISAQEAQLAQLGATLGPRHPRRLELESHIAATRAALRREIEVYASSNTAQIASGRELEDSLKRAVAEQRAKVLGVRQEQDEGAKLLLELESAQAVYKRALDGYDEIMFASGGKLTNASLMTRAAPAVTPSKPKKLKYMVLGAAAALLSGLLAPLAHEMWFNRRVRCRDDLELDFGMPVLAVLDRSNKQVSLS